MQLNLSMKMNTDFESHYSDSVFVIHFNVQIKM